MERLPDVGSAGCKALELHQLDDQVGSAGQGRFLQQRLLGANVERRDLRNGIDQHLIVQLPNRTPVDSQSQRIAEPLSLAFDFGPLGKAERIGLRIVISG